MTFIDAQKLTYSFEGVLGVVRKCGCNFLVFYFGIFMSKFKKKKLLRGYLRWPLLPRVQLWCKGLKFESETKVVSYRLRLPPLMLRLIFLNFHLSMFWAWVMFYDHYKSIHRPSLAWRYLVFVQIDAKSELVFANLEPVLFFASGEDTFNNSRLIPKI